MRFWAEAISAAANFYNLFISPQSDNQTSLEVAGGQKPRVDHLRFLGCLAWAHVSDNIRNKLSGKAEKSILIRCVKRTHYKVWLIIRKIAIIIRHIRIYEDPFPARMWTGGNERLEYLDETQPGPIQTTQNNPRSDSSSPIIRDANSVIIFSWPFGICACSCRLITSE